MQKLPIFVMMYLSWVCDFLGAPTANTGIVAVQGLAMIVVRYILIGKHPLVGVELFLHVVVVLVGDEVVAVLVEISLAEVVVQWQMKTYQFFCDSEKVFEFHFLLFK